MRTKRMTGFGALTTSLAVAALSVPASAASPTTTYNGTFGGTIRYEECTTQPPTTDTTTGTWSVTLHGNSAKSVFEIFVNSQPHVAYTFAGMKQLPVQEPTVFSVTGKTQAGRLTVTLSGSRLTYTIAPYNYGGLSCESVTYPGSL